MIIRALTLSIVLAISPAVVAKESVIGMNQEVYEALTEAQTEFENSNSKKAIDVLEQVRHKRSAQMTDYENAHVLNMMAAIQQDLGNTPKALALYSQALEYPDIPDTLRINLYRNLAQLEMMSEHYAKALDLIRKVIAASPTPDATTHVLESQALYYMEKYGDARKAIEKAIELDGANGKAPRESWLQLANAIYYGQQDYKAMLRLNHQLMALYPRDRYLMNLAAIYGELEQTDKQLALIEAVFEGGYIKESNKLMNLANLYLLHETPYKGALLIEKAMADKKVEESTANVDRLAQAWLMAGEYQRALPYLERAADKGKGGESYIRLANTYMALGKWQQTADALNKAVAKGDLNDPGTAYLVMGMARFRLKQFDKAETAFERSKDYKNTARLATQWNDYMKSEIAKIKALEAAAAS